MQAVCTHSLLNNQLCEHEQTLLLFVNQVVAYNAQRTGSLPFGIHPERKGSFFSNDRAVS